MVLRKACSFFEGEQSLGVVEFLSRADGSGSPVEVVLGSSVGGGALGTAAVVFSRSIRGSDSVGLVTRAF